MRLFVLATLPSLAFALPALAHPGHMAGLAGHDHWVAGAAIGAAIALGAWAALKGRRGAKAARPREDDAARPVKSEG